MQCIITEKPSNQTYKLWWNKESQIVRAKETSKIVIEYDQEIPQSQTADNPMAPWGRAIQPSGDTAKTNKQSNQLSLPHQDDCNTSMDIK